MPQEGWGNKFCERDTNERIEDRHKSLKN